MGEFPVVITAAKMLANATGVPLGLIPTGKVYWLDSSDSYAADNYFSGTYNAPYATLKFAVSQCIAGRGDLILVKPGHSELVGEVVPVKDMTVFGLVNRRGNRPQLILHAPGPTLTSQILVPSTATGTWWHGIDFISDLASASPSDGPMFSAKETDGTVISCCRFYPNEITDQSVGTISIGGWDSVAICNEIWFKNNTYTYWASIEYHADSANAGRGRIINNTFFDGVPGGGPDSASIKIFASTYSAVDMEIRGNRLFNNFSDDVNFIDAGTNTSGMISRNIGYCGNDLTPLNSQIAPDSCGVCQNFLTDDLSKTSTTIPTGVST